MDLLVDSTIPRTRDAGQPPKEYQLLKSLVERVKLRSHQNEALAFDVILDPILKRMRDGPAEAIAKGAAMSVLVSKKGADDTTAGEMNGQMKSKNSNQEALRQKAPARKKKKNLRQLPRSMPFEDLNRVRAERDAFQRYATSIQTDAKSSRWINEE